MVEEKEVVEQVDSLGKIILKALIYMVVMVTMVIGVYILAMIAQPSKEDQLKGVEEQYRYMGYLFGDKIGYVVLENKPNKINFGARDAHVYYKYSEGDTWGLADFINMCNKLGGVDKKDCILEGTDGNFYKIYGESTSVESILNIFKVVRIIEIDEKENKIRIPATASLEGWVEHGRKSVEVEPVNKSVEEKYELGLELAERLGAYLVVSEPYKEALMKDIIKADVNKRLGVQVQKGSGVLDSYDREYELEEGKEKGYRLEKTVGKVIDLTWNGTVQKIDARYEQLGNISYAYRYSLEYKEKILEVMEWYAKELYDLTEKDLREIYKLGEKGEYKGVKWGKVLPQANIETRIGGLQTMFELNDYIEEEKGNREVDSKIERIEM